MYHIFHIFHRLGRFSNVLSSGFSTLFLPISFQLSSLLVGHHMFPIRDQLFHPCFFCQISHSQFFSLLDCFSAFLFQFFSFHSSSQLCPNLRISQYSAFPSKCGLPNSPSIPKSSSHFIFYLAYLLFVSRRRVFFAAFFLGFRLDTLTPSYSWDSVLLDWSSPSSYLLLPLAANFHYCQSSLSFPSTLYFPKSPIYNHSSTSARNLPVAPRSVLSFRYFPEATFRFQFFQILIFRGAHTNTSDPHPAILGSSMSFIYFHDIFMLSGPKSMY